MVQGNRHEPILPNKHSRGWGKCRDINSWPFQSRDLSNLYLRPSAESIFAMRNNDNVRDIFWLQSSYSPREFVHYQGKTALSLLASVSAPDLVRLVATFYSLAEVGETM